MVGSVVVASAIGREHEVPQPLNERVLGDPGHARGWQDAERDGEDQDQDDAQPEDRDRKPDRAEEAQQMIEGTPAAQRLDQAHRDADPYRHQERGSRERERVREPLADALRDRLVGEQRRPEVAAHRARRPLHVVAASPACRGPCA